MFKDDVVSVGVVSGEIELIFFSVVFDRGDDIEVKEECWLGGKLLGKLRLILIDFKFWLIDDCFVCEFVDCVDFSVCKFDIGIFLVCVRLVFGRWLFFEEG